jgi:hypothetical protein
VKALEVENKVDIFHRWYTKAAVRRCVRYVAATAELPGSSANSAVKGTGFK